MSRAVLEISALSKSFPGVRALREVSLRIEEGEVHCLVGANGAGKSTLVKILSGAMRWDSGGFAIDGHQAPQLDPLSALRLGIGTVYQESALVGTLSAVDNIFLGRELNTRWGAVDYRSESRAVGELFRKLNINVDMRKLTRELSIAQRQMIEIAKLVSLDAHIIILDEPTSSLDPRDVETLMNLIRTLQAEGKSIVFVSHKLEEVKTIATKISIIRDGNLIGTFDNDELEPDRIISLMIGRSIGGEAQEATAAPTGRQAQDVALRVEGLSDGSLLQDISFSVLRGEVVGFTGLVGAGKTELAECLFGFRRMRSGSVSVGGRPVAIRDPTAAIANGIGLVTDDRLHKGLVSLMAIDRNLTLSSLSVLSKFGLLDAARERSLCQEFAQKLRIKCGSLSDLVSNLSGGNQQKVLLAKWLLRGSRILILDEPTRGIDVGTKAEIYRLIGELAREGVSIIVLSSELEEVLRVSTHIFVLRNGGIAKEFTGVRPDREQLFASAFFGANAGSHDGPALN